MSTNIFFTLNMDSGKKPRYIAQPQSGGTSATFYYDDEDSLPVGEQLPYAYAVFPYTSELAMQYSDIRETLNKVLLAIGTPCQFNNSPDACAAAEGYVPASIAEGFDRSE